MPRLAVAVACSGLIGCVAWAVLAAPNDHFGGLSYLLALAWLIIAPLYIALDGYSDVWTPRTLIERLPSALINVALAVGGAAIYVKVGLGAIIFALAAVFAFSYMAHLLEQSRHRAQQY